MVAPVTTSLLSLPNSKVPVLLEDGTFSVPWRRALQQLFIRAGGSQDNVNASITALQSAIAALSSQVTEIDQDVTESLDASQAGQLLGLIDLSQIDLPIDDMGALLLANLGASPDPQDTTDVGTQLLAYLGMSNLDLSTSSGSSLEIDNQGSSITSGATKINFTGSGVTASAVGTNVTVTVPGGSGPPTFSPPLASLFPNTLDARSLSPVKADTPYGFAMNVPSSGGAFNTGIEAFYKTTPGGGSSAFNVDAIIDPGYPSQLAVTSGLLLYENASGKSITFGWTGQGSNGSIAPFEISVQEWSSTTVISSTLFTLAGPPGLPFFRISFDGTTYSFQISFNKTYFYTVASANKSFFTTNANNIGLFIDPHMGNSGTLMNMNMTCPYYVENG